jgi:carotenoid cleavage dioxygenase-like enzyme
METTSVSAVGGFDPLEAETHVERLPVQGELPDWLAGALIRTGPAKWEVGERQMNHWFDGFAMLHRFSFAGGEVSYQNRFLETRAYRAAREKGRITYSEFATDPCRSLFQRVVAMFTAPKLTDNGNVNLTKLGERWIAMTETPIPVQFDPQTLAAAGVAYQPPGQLTTAHPHRDRATAGLLNYAANLGFKSTYQFFLVRPGSSQPEEITRMPVQTPGYMHSFGLTQRWLVLAEFPFVVSPTSLAKPSRPYIENYRWKPEQGTRGSTCSIVPGRACSDRSRPMRALHSTTSTLTRTVTRSSWTSAPSRTRGSCGTFTWTGCAQASR